MISILISAYETEQYIVECVKAFNNQSYFKNNPNYEILIGVDGCKKTLEELKKHLKEFKNVRVFWANVNQGTYKMFNRLMYISTGSKILRFDSDDLSSVEMIEKLESYIKDYDVVRMNYLSDSGKSEFPSFGQIYFKRGLIHHFGGYQDWPISADRELLERLSPNFKIGIIDETIFYKRDRPNSLTRNDNTGYNSSLREEYKSIIDNSNIKELYIKPIKTNVTEIHAFNINDVSDFFKKRHGDYFDFTNPKTFTEKIVWRKLFEKDPLFITLSDKHTMRDYVNKAGLSDLLVDLLDVIEFDDFTIDSLLDLPDCVIKASHGYNMQIFKKSGVFYDIKNKVMTNDDIINTISNWKTYKHGNTNNYLYEWSYSNIIKPVIIVEPFIEDIIDINLQCFNGEVTYIFVFKDRFTNIKESYYDKQWNLLGDINVQNKGVELPKIIKPSYLDELINVAEKLSENIGYCRVDFLCTENSFKLNEISLYNASGLSKKRDYKYDLYLGEKWPIRLNSYNISDEPHIKSYCINLVNKNNKFEKIKSELSKINIHPNRFVVEKQNLTKMILREGVNEKSNQILESHLKLLKHLESIDQPHFIIFEDDIKVIKDIDVDEIISSAPKDWDVIYLGGMNHYHTPKIIDNKFYKCKFSFNAHAFIVKKEFMPKMIEHLEKREYENDVIFAYMQSNGVGNWYGLIEDAIIQDGVDSPTFITTLSDNCFSVVNKMKGNFNLSKKEPEIDKFYEFVLMCKGLIPYLSKEIPVIDKKSYKKSLLVETRELEHNEFVIKNTIQKLGDGWGHIIYCHENNYSQIKSICDDISTDIEIRLVEKDLDRNDYNNLLLDINFWNEIDCEKVLIYQTDTFIAKKFDDSFLEFDYIGAPWGPSSHSDFLKNHLNIEIDLLIGNGGLSIRDVEKSKSCLIDGYVANHRNNRTDLTLDEPPEDVIFSLYFYDKKYPSLQRSIDFSCEISLNLDSFGFHKPWNIFNDTYSMTKELKKKFFQKEKKRILFINHEESLTGAPILLKNLIDFEKDTDDFDVWCVSLKNSNGEWDFKQKFYSSDIPGDSDPEKVKYLQEILNPDFVYANTIVTMSFAKNFICDKLISIHEYRSLIPYLSNLKEDLSNFDRVIVACEPAQKLLKSIDLDSTCVPYYLNLKNKSQVFKNVSEGLIVGSGQAQLRKGLHRFIEIAKKLPNKKFAWIGCIDGIEMNEGSIKIEGPNFLLSDFQIGSEIKKITFVLDLPSNVKFLGLKSQKETFEIISNSECFLMLSSDDPFPLVAIEAKLSNTSVVNLKESGDSYKVCNSEDLVLENYDCDKIVQYLENISNNKKYLNLNLINQIENNLSVNRKQYLSFLNRKMKVFLAIDSNSEKFSYDLLRKSIVSLKKFDYEIKVVTDKMTDDLLDVSEVCEIIIFDSEITKHIRVHFENYKQVAGGYYTLEISKICIERNYTDKFVVYCDYDIICNRKFDYLLPFYTEYLAASPEWEKQNSTYFNSGIVLFNVKNTFSRYEIIKNLVLNNEFLEFHDQSILNEVFKGYFTQLDNRMNWKPYWGITADFHIIHYHWLKPHMDIESKDILEKIKNIGNNILDHQSIRYFMQFWRKK